MMVSPSNVTKRRRSTFTWRRRLVPYVFIAPNLFIFLTFIIWPALRGIYISFFDSMDGSQFTYVGTANYKAIFNDPTVATIARNTAIYVVFYMLISTLLSLTFAIIINQQKFARGFFRSIVFLPVMLSPIVVGLIWNDVLDRKVGPLNTLLEAIGGGSPGWLVEPKLGMISAIFVGVWVHLGFYTIILLAGLQGIDSSIFEAATMDGATRWQITRRITLPLLKPTTLIIVILSTIHGFQSFDFIYTLTGGGPLGATTLIVQYIYERAFQSPIQYGLGSAAGVILFLIIFAFTALNFLVGKRREAI
ncbi:MAG: sugar ABC transporter permease [Actinobacteria bacterium]|nr:sugar ABC transporter permease [Actinomycetota bacterium]NCU89856.1 sugar ABC transporter permease [Actinomycetota bacterium]NDE54337.1 sugar ABC transporter permease [Actinomycetota bacterium]